MPCSRSLRTKNNATSSATLAIGLAAWALTRGPIASTDDTTGASDTQCSGGLHAGDREPPEPTPRDRPHRGTVLSVHAGPAMCLGAFCRGDRHAISPGPHVGGFFGGNIHGWVEMGVGGGWSSLVSNAGGGENPLSMYGLDGERVAQSIDAAGMSLDLDLGSLAASEVRTQTAQVGPIVRVHLRPRGRFMAWVGSGAAYHLLRNDYATDDGSVRMDFHGMGVPLEGGIGVALHDHFAVFAQVTHLWTWHFVSVLESAAQTTVIPTGALQEVARAQGTDLLEELPTLLTVAAGVRTRF